MMGHAETALLQSKLLVLDSKEVFSDCLQAFCQDHGLIGIRPHQADGDSIMAILASNVDFGGVMLYEHHGGRSAGIELARRMHMQRPELPIFLRRDRAANLAGLAEQDALMFSCAYALSDLAALKSSLDTSIFSRLYPNDLVRNIAEMSRQVLAQLFPHCDVDLHTPTLAVKDRTVYGELFTLIAIESNWCRGYMMLQAEEEALRELMLCHPAFADERGLAPGELDSMMGEATNMIWGSFKNRYAGAEALGDGLRTQVPIIVNQRRRAVSFGSDDPQLCLRYQLRQHDNPEAEPTWFMQRFIFNLCWAPENFRESPTVESLVETGELELF